MMHVRFKLALTLLLPLLMGLGIQGGDDEEGGMGGSGHSMGAPIDFPETSEVPEILDELLIALLNMEVGPANGRAGIDVEMRELVD